MANDLHLIERFKPKSLNQVIGNKLSITKFDNWIKNINSNKNKFLILNGKNGIGKSLITNLILEKYNYDFYKIYPDQIKNLRNNDDFNDFYNYKNSIFNKIKDKNKTTTNFAIIFEDTETITLTSEKKYIQNIFKNKNVIDIPIIFICNNNHSKLLNDLKKLCDEIKFYPPSSIDLIKFIKNICSIEKIQIEDTESIEKLISLSQYDIRRLLNLMEDYKYNYKKISNKNIDKFIDVTIKKDSNLGLYEATDLLLNENNSFYDIIKIYESDKVLIPLMIQENYYKKISSSKKSFNDKLEYLNKISDAISIGDTIETSIYTDQNWYLQDIHGFYTCVNPSKLLNEINNPKKEFIKFSSDLNKTSLKNINKKNIKNLEKIIGNKSIDEILCLCKLTNKNNDNNFENIINILKEYKKDLDIKDLELCLKIDKTVEFLTLSTKEKKLLVKHYSL